MARKLLLSSLLAICFAAGCSSGKVAQYTPKEDRAQEALTAVLQAWQTDKPSAEMDGATIRVADSQRRKGQKLRSYEILGELPADAGRRYQVKLVLDNPAAETKAQYVVVGIDPLWVFRQEDYDMMTHWDHPMPTANGNGKAGGKASGS